MKKIIVFVFVALIIFLLIFIIRKNNNALNETPVLQDVTKVFIEFYVKENNHKINEEVLDPLVKENLADFFGRGYRFVENICDCPDDDIKVIFETKKNITHSFSFGVYGDGNAYYYNADKNFSLSYEQYTELLEIFSGFDEISKYYSQSNFDRIKTP